MGSKAGSKFLHCCASLPGELQAGPAPPAATAFRVRPAKLEAPAPEPRIVFRDVADNQHHATMD